MFSRSLRRLPGLLSGAMAVALAGNAPAEVTFSFEEADPLAASLISGDKASFATDSTHARTGSKSVRFVGGPPAPFESWTYDVPFAITSGTITIWFYDARGESAVNFNPAAARWGGSVILEDADNPSDFGAVEICEFAYGGPAGAYYATEGSVDRGVAGDRFDSNSLPGRTVGHHKIEFVVGPAETIVKVDGQAADEIRAPGGDGRTLRLRIMADSATAGSSGNWVTSTATGPRVTLTPWIYYDDLSFDAELPAPASHTMGFEVVSGTAEYDTAGEYMVAPAHDNPNMAGFVNQWDVITSTAVARSGERAAYFAHPPATFQSLVFDLSAAAPGTTATVWFYDAEGPSTVFDKFGGSVIVESGLNPAEFLAVEIWNAPYPYGGGTPNYYLTKGSAGTPNSGMLYSRKLGDRGIGWHKVEIGLYADYSLLFVDGETDAEGTGIILGPGLDKSPKLRLMADSATSGGFSNWVGVDELQTAYVQSTDPYIFYDDITLPVAGNTSVADWAIYE